MHFTDMLSWRNSVKYGTTCIYISIEQFGIDTSFQQFIQHDVQELNRILFSAIESSLVGTSGKDIISKLYHGRLVNKVGKYRLGIAT